MKSRRALKGRLWVEALESRLVPTVTSTNWSGYAVTAPADTVTAVSGSWIVPTVTGKVTAYSSSWVGIDGYSSSTVEQLGTEADTSRRGAATYYAWYEMYPNASVEINMTIHPGDTITASVTYNSGVYTLKMADGTQSFSITKSNSTFQRSSAEWIMEAPSSNRGVLPLADFGTETFSASSATIGGISGPITNATWTGTQVEQINMVTNSGSALDSTSALNAAGTGFTVTYTGSTKSSNLASNNHSGVGRFRDTNLPASQQAATLGVTGSTQAEGSINAELAAFLLSQSGLRSLPAFPSAATLSLAGTLPSTLVSPVLPPASIAQASQAPGMFMAIPDSGRPVEPVVPPMNEPGNQGAPDTNPDAVVPILTPAYSPSNAGSASGMGDQSNDDGFLQARWVPVAPEEEVRTVSGPAAVIGSTVEPAAALFLTFALGSTRGLAVEERAERRQRPSLH